MANMSYCRFENTKQDMNECLDAIEDETISSEEEAYHGIRMFRHVLDLMEDYDVIEGYDREELERLLKGAVEE